MFIKKMKEIFYQ